MRADGANLIKLTLKGAILAVCLYATFSGTHPPAVAQVQQLSAEDATQDADIRAINKHLESTDKNVADLQVAQNLNGMAVAEMQGENRVIGGVLAAMMTASIVIQVVVKTKKAA